MAVILTYTDLVTKLSGSKIAQVPLPLPQIENLGFLGTYMVMDLLGALITALSASRGDDRRTGMHYAPKLISSGCPLCHDSSQPLGELPARLGDHQGTTATPRIIAKLRELVDHKLCLALSLFAKLSVSQSCPF